MYSDQQAAVPRRVFKKTVDVNQGRVDRRQDGISLRREKREEMIAKKRKEEAETVSADVTVVQPQNTRENEVPDVRRLKEYVELCDDADHVERYFAVRAIRKMLSVESHPETDAVIQAGAIPLLCKNLTDIDHPKTQHEACWALTNIASGSSAQCGHVVRSDAPAHFKVILEDCQHDQPLVEQAVWAVGNVAGDSPEFRDIMLDVGIMDGLLQTISNHDFPITTRRQATWAFSNICRGKTPHAPLPHLEKAVQPLAWLVLNETDEDIRQDSMWALSYISEVGKEGIALVLAQEGLLPQLVEYMRQHEHKHLTPALRCIGNICAGVEEQVEQVLAHDIFEVIHPLLTHNRKTIRKEALWAISNIVAGPKEHIDRCMRTPIIPAALSLLADSQQTQEIRRECVWIATNVTAGGKSEHIKYLVDECALIQTLLCAMNLSETKSVIAAIDALENVVMIGDEDEKESAQGAGNIYLNYVRNSSAYDILMKIQDSTSSTKLFNKAGNFLKLYLVQEETGLVDEDEDNNVDQQDQENYNESSTLSFGRSGKNGGFSSNRLAEMNS